MYTYIVKHLPKNSKKRPGHPMKPKYLTIHDTGNPKSTAQDEANWLTNPLNVSSTGFHIVVDEKNVIELIPPCENAWHAGDGENGPGNRESIGVELCESGNREKTVENAAFLAATLIKAYGLTLKQHYDWSGKDCPRLLRQGNNWQKFVDKVNTHLAAMSGKEVPGEDYKQKYLNLVADIKALMEKYRP